MMDDHDIMAISNNGIAHETGPCEELSEVEVAHENSDIKSHENETRQSVVEEVALINNIGDFKVLKIESLSTKDKVLFCFYGRFKG